MFILELFKNLLNGMEGGIKDSGLDVAFVASILILFFLLPWYEALGLFAVCALGGWCIAKAAIRFKSFEKFLKDAGILPD